MINQIGSLEENLISFIFEMTDKRHCCCCVPLQEGVVLVGIYGSSFHTALLIVQVILN